MDFANEYGFKNNSDAWNLWNLSVKTYLKENKPIESKDIQVNVNRLQKLGIIKERA